LSSTVYYSYAKKTMRSLSYELTFRRTGARIRKIGDEIGFITPKNEIRMNFGDGFLCGKVI